MGQRCCRCPGGELLVGMRSGAEEIDYSKDLPAGTLQLLDLMEKMLHEDDLRIFPEDLYAQGHVLHSPETVVYSPKELMEMDWLDECVEGALPHYDELDVKRMCLWRSTASIP